MLTKAQFDQIERFIDVDPVEVALKSGDKEVAQAVAGLQKAKSKAPSFYQARCELTTVMVEQSTSETVAVSREIKNGKTAIDLTCGMGVDTWALAKRFGRVIGVEIDQERANVTRENLKRLGVVNVEIVCDSAENFIAQFDGHVDLVFCDPSRRTIGGKRLYGLEDCAPNVIELMPKLEKIADTIVIKLSPLFDVDALFKLFSNISVEVISLNNECKEVVLKKGANVDCNTIQLTVIKGDSIRKTNFAVNQKNFAKKTKESWNFILQPDVAFYKSRTVGQYLQTFKEIEATFESYVFCDQVPIDFIGKSWQIKSIHLYQPKVLKSLLKSKEISKATIIHREFVDSTEQIGKSLGIKEGGRAELIFTQLNGKNVVIFI